MKPKIFWIENPLGNRVAILPRPNGGGQLLNEVTSLRNSGVELLVSLLTRDEVTESGLTLESEICKKIGIDFLIFPIADHAVPASQATADRFTHDLFRKVQGGTAIGIHCRIGIGRSPMIAACLFVLSGISTENVWRLIEESRNLPVPDNMLQRRWVSDFASRTLAKSNFEITS